MPKIYQRLGFGTAGLTSMKSYGSVMRLLDAAYDSGITHFDTAPLYGQGYTEELVGRFLKNKRERLTITTKFGLGVPKQLMLPAFMALPLNYYRKALNKSPSGQQMVSGPPSQSSLPYRSIKAEDVRNSFEISLKRLRTDYLDYYFLHEGIPDFLDIEAMEFLLDRKQKGYIRFLGIATGSQNILGLKQENIACWDVLQYEAGENGKLLREQFSGKQHFVHSCLKNIPKTGVSQAGDELTGGYQLAASAKESGNSKVIFSTRRLQVLKHNLEGFTTGMQMP